MPKRNVKERRKRALEFKRLVQAHGGRKTRPSAVKTAADDLPQRELEQVTK